jgi:ribosome-associated toxin RatA of RatAB toxin-antitoxin module
MEAELSVGFQFFSEKYLSRVTLEPERRVLVSSTASGIATARPCIVITGPGVFSLT